VAVEVLVVVFEDFSVKKIFLDRLKFKGNHTPSWDEVNCKDIVGWTVSQLEQATLINDSESKSIAVLTGNSIQMILFFDWFHYL
jgi:hypothetical protein